MSTSTRAPITLQSAGVEISEHAIPHTRAHALLLAQAWGHTLSHWKTMIGDSLDPDTRRFAQAATAQADAAEVQRLAALWSMLPDPGAPVELGVEPLALSEAEIQGILAITDDEPDGALTPLAAVDIAIRGILDHDQRQGVHDVLQALLPDTFA